MPENSPPDHAYIALHKKVDDLVASSAHVIAPLINSRVRPHSVLDVGCGNGLWLATFAEAGVTDLLGIDGDYLDPSARRIPPTCFRPHDLTTPFNLGRKFDLVVCLEVAEHLPDRVAVQFVGDLTRHGPVVLFSAAIPGQGGVGHVNERPQSYCAGKFATFDYVPIDAIRPRIWADPTVAYWYAQNTLLYVRRDAVQNYPQLAAEADRDPATWLLDVVHPSRLRAVCRDLAYARSPSLSAAVGEVPGAAARFVRRILGSERPLTDSAGPSKDG